VAWLSRVGADSLGRFVIDTLEKEGLDCRHVDIDPAHPTGFSSNPAPMTAATRRRVLPPWLGGQSLVAAFDRARFAQGPAPARHRHPAGAVGNGAADVVRIDDRMRDAGRSVSFDPNLRPSLWASEHQMIREINRLAALAHWVLPGLSEGRLLTGFEDPADIAAFYLDQGAEAVAIKLGPHGAYYRTHLDAGFVAGVPVQTVVDTVGAGDGFAVGMISALLENHSFAEAVQRANWIGSRRCRAAGTWRGCRPGQKCPLNSRPPAGKPAPQEPPILWERACPR
jgi:dehydrogluconokinase